jgi:signal transduction histidine kinase
LPTRLNTTYFDLSICEPGYGPLWLYIYALEVLAIVFVGILGVHYFKKTTEPDFKKQIAWLSIASVLFLSIFAATNIAGDALALYEVNLIGPIGMVLFIAFLAFMIVRFKAFSIKLLGTQALVTTIFAVTFAILFIRQIENVRYVVIATLVLLAVVGRSLIKSVKREVQAREEIEVLAKNLDTRNTELKISNDNQSTLIHVMNHQIKGYLGMAKNIFAELLLSNDYGQVPEAAKPILKQGLETTDNGVNYVQSILRGASALNGTLPFDMKTVDIKPIVLGLITQQKDVAEKSDFALTFESHVVDGDYNTVGDSIQLTECFKNLITNGIKYNNPHGSLKVDLFQRDGKIIFEVKDSGDGVAEDVKPRLFTAGGMSKDSPKKNKEASGFGLALVKGVADAHRGTVGFRSNAPEKGSTFFIELPIVSSLVK